jgi:hypothetical protein
VGAPGAVRLALPHHSSTLVALRATGAHVGALGQAERFETGTSIRHSNRSALVPAIRKAPGIRGVRAARPCGSMVCVRVALGEQGFERENHEPTAFRAFGSFSFLSEFSVTVLLPLGSWPIASTRFLSARLP